MIRGEGSLIEGLDSIDCEGLIGVAPAAVEPAAVELPRVELPRVESLDGGASGVESLRVGPLRVGLAPLLGTGTWLPRAWLPRA